MHGGLTEVKLLLYKYAIMIMYKLHYVDLPNKYLELNQTKAIMRVYAFGSNTPYNLYTNAHPFYGAIIKLEKL